MEEPQDTPQAPQLVRSVMVSVQRAPQARWSDGQTGAFVGAGLVRGVSGIMDGDRFSARAEVSSGKGVSITTYDVTTGVTIVRVVPANIDDGKIPAVPGFVSTKKIISITITAMPAPARILPGRSGSGCAPGVTLPDCGIDCGPG
jgi:hypothetical protein